MDYRSEIPTWAFINGQIIQDAVRSGDLSRSIERVERSYGLSPGSLKIINPAYMISLLYCLLVVPKVLCPDPKLAAMLGVLDPKSVLKLVTISRSASTPNSERDAVLDLVRHLRNALSHVRSEISDNGDFTFWDQKGSSSPINFQATFTRLNLEKFLNTVGSVLANKVRSGSQ
jgi:hypothetical protein